jgi:hypothetical protein
MSLLYKSESGKLEKYGYKIPGVFGIDYVSKFWISEVEDKDFSYMLKWVDDNLTWEKNNAEEMWKSYNCFTFDHPSIHKLKKDIHNQYLQFMKELGEEPEGVYINGWFNLYQKGQGQRIHYHNFSESAYLTGIVVLTEGDTSTDFMVPSEPEIVPNYNKPLHDKLKIQNYPGALVFFPQWTYHYVDQLKDDIKRVTIGFDLFTERGMKIIEKTTETNHMYRKAIKLS